MSTEGIPELGIPPERVEELTQLNRMIRSRCVHLWDFVIELERLQGVTTREKLAMMAAMAHTTLEGAVIARTRQKTSIIIQGLN